MDRVNFDCVRKDLWKLPNHILNKLKSWATDVEFHGIKSVRMVPGYHDEPLRGKRAGQRSIRLSAHYRAIYVEEKNGEINIIKIVEVNKHEY